MVYKIDRSGLDAPFPNSEGGVPCHCIAKRLLSPSSFDFTFDRRCHATREVLRTSHSPFHIQADLSHQLLSPIRGFTMMVKVSGYSPTKSHKTMDYVTRK